MTERQLLRPLGTGGRSSGDDVGMAIVVNIAKRQRVWAGTNRERRGSASEVSTPIAECNRDVIVCVVDCGEIEFAITVQIADSETMCVRVVPFFHQDRGVRSESQTSFAITQQ